MKWEKTVSYFWNSDNLWFMIWNIFIKCFEALMSWIWGYISVTCTQIAQIVVLINNERGQRNFIICFLTEKGETIVCFKNESGAFAMRSSYLKGQYFYKMRNVIVKHIILFISKTVIPLISISLIFTFFLIIISTISCFPTFTPEIFNILMPGYKIFHRKQQISTAKALNLNLNDDDGSTFIKLKY